MAFLSLSGCYASLVNAEWPSLSSLWLVAQCWGTCVASRSPGEPTAARFPSTGNRAPARLLHLPSRLPEAPTTPACPGRPLAGPVWAGQPRSGSSPAIFCGCPWLTGNARIPAYQRARSFHSLSLCLSLLLPPPAPFQLFPPSPSPSPAPNHKGARQVSFCSDKEDILPGNKTPGSPLAGTPTFRAPSTSSLPLSSPILESERENSPTTNHDLLISQGLKRGREDSCLSLVPPHRLGKCWKDTYTAPPSESPVGTYLGSTVYSSGSDSDHSSEFPSDAWGSPD